MPLARQTDEDKAQFYPSSRWTHSSETVLLFNTCSIGGLGTDLTNDYTETSTEPGKNLQDQNQTEQFVHLQPQPLPSKAFCWTPRQAVGPALSWQLPIKLFHSEITFLPEENIIVHNSVSHCQERKAKIPHQHKKPKHRGPYSTHH